MDTSNLKAKVEADIAAIDGATPVEDLLALAKAADRVSADRTTLDTELQARITALGGAAALEDKLALASSLPLAGYGGERYPIAAGHEDAVKAGSDVILDSDTGEVISARRMSMLHVSYDYAQQTQYSALVPIGAGDKYLMSINCENEVDNLRVRLYDRDTRDMVEQKVTGSLAYYSSYEVPTGFIKLSDTRMLIVTYQSNSAETALLYDIEIIFTGDVPTDITISGNNSLRTSVNTTPFYNGDVRRSLVLNDGKVLFVSAQSSGTASDCQIYDPVLKSFSPYNLISQIKYSGITQNCKTPTVGLEIGLLHHSSGKIAIASGDSKVIFCDYDGSSLTYHSEVTTSTGNRPVGFFELENGDIRVLHHTSSRIYSKTVTVDFTGTHTASAAESYTGTGSAQYGPILSVPGGVAVVDIEGDNSFAAFIPEPAAGYSSPSLKAMPGYGMGSHAGQSIPSDSSGGPVFTEFGWVCDSRAVYGAYHPTAGARTETHIGCTPVKHFLSMMGCFSSPFSHRASVVDVVDNTAFVVPAETKVKKPSLALYARAFPPYAGSNVGTDLPTYAQVVWSYDSPSDMEAALSYKSSAGSYSFQLSVVIDGVTLVHETYYSLAKEWEFYVKASSCFSMGLTVHRRATDAIRMTFSNVRNYGVNP